MRVENVAEFEEEEHGVVWRRSFYGWDEKVHVRAWAAVSAVAPELPEFKSLMQVLLQRVVPTGVQAGAERLFCMMADHAAPLASRMEFSDGAGKFELGYAVERERVDAVGYQMAISGYVYVGRTK